VRVGLNLIGRGAARSEPLSSNKPRSRQEHVNLTLRVTQELLEHLDQWRAQHFPQLSRNATVVAILEERIIGEGAATRARLRKTGATKEKPRRSEGRG
jgi:hypothetical protein